jgi:hypothetical protein
MENSNKMVEQMLRLVDLSSIKENYKLKFVFNSTDYTQTFLNPITLSENRNYVFYLKRFSVYNTLFNVNTNNNKFIYSINSGVTWITITVPSGAYEVKALNTTIQALMKNNGHYNSTNSTYYINISADESTSKTIMTINNSTYRVDFSKPNTFNTLLGFNPQVYSNTINISESIIMITLTNDIDIHCSLVTSNSYVNGERKPILYSLSAYSIPVGAKIILSELDAITIPLNTKTIDVVNFKIKDDNGKLLDFNGETIIIDCVIKQV